MTANKSGVARMAKTRTVPPPPELPKELVEMVAAEGERDADFVGQFLKDMGLIGKPGQHPKSLPKPFLLFLATALRFLDWETRGIFFSDELDIPTAREVYGLARQSLRDPSLDPTELRMVLHRLSITRFAWSGQSEMNADFVLDEPDEELFLDALADFLWELVQ
jgi:hypothetical protein